MAVPASVHGEVRYFSATRVLREREVCAVEDRPLRIAQHEPDVVAAQSITAAFCLNRKRRDSTRWRSSFLSNVGNFAEVGLGGVGINCEIFLHHRAESRRIVGLRPAETG